MTVTTVSRRVGRTGAPFRIVAEARASTETYSVGPLQILPDEHLARAGGRTLMFSTRELRLLTEFARREDRIVSRDELFALVWSRTMRPRDRSVDVYVRKLRVKLAEALPEWRFIHTHFGFGYRLAAERHSMTTWPSHLDNNFGPAAHHPQRRIDD